MRWIVLSAVLMMLMGCGTAPSATRISYDFSNPAHIWDLPPELQEASGVCTRSKDTLAIISDESMVIWLFSLPQGRIVDKIHSTGLADVEGIEWEDGKYILLSSDGILHTMTEGVPASTPTPLSTANNPEGLAWDPISQKLLIACKGLPLDRARGRRCVYAFDLASQTLDSTPFLRISTEQIARHPKGAAMVPFEGEGRKSRFAPAPKPNREAVFQPSGIAIHPISNNIYVLSAGSRLIAEFDRQGALIDLHQVFFGHLPKAEGICFGPDGTMYIVSEKGGKHIPPRLVAFRMLMVPV